MRRHDVAWVAGATLLTISAGLIGCSGSSSTPQSAAAQPTVAGGLAPAASSVAGAAANGGGNSSAGGPDTGAAAPGGEAAGGEAATVTYTDPAGQYSFGYPAGWAKSTSKRGGVRFDGRNQVVIFDLIANAGTNAAAFAKSDESALTTEFPGFQVAGIAASSIIPNAAVMTFQWQATNPVTGKPVVERAARYYIPASGGRMAVLTDSAELAQFDPQNSADLARTVQVR
ncbi:MAG TPA: hypothetical protein VEZ14_13835 [Dehalococcoidia bacterium]|nr:hypothetical protein [Dehalococcoidia bacterium]